MSLISKPATSCPTSEEPPDNNNNSNSSTSVSRKLGRLSLNPNAQEFVPSKASSGGSSRGVGIGNGPSTTITTTTITETRIKANLDRTSSSNSNTSDDEYRQYFRSQLPDDLISDSDFTSEIYPDSNQYDSDLSFARGAPRSSTPSSSGLRAANGSFPLQDHNGVDGEADEVHPINFLASEFPNFAVGSLSDIYYANGCDLTLTLEILAQLELQEEGVPSRRQAAVPVSAPSLTPMDFPSLPGVEIVNGLTGARQRPMELQPRRFEQGIDFAAVVRKQAAQQPSSHWPFERSVGDITIGGRGSVQSLGSAYGYGGGGGGGAGAGAGGGGGGARAQQPWLETGDAVANLYNEYREEAKDHARLRNACFEQARQAYLLGNKALAKELSNKGQIYNEQMKAAHNKAAEAIFHQRNSSLLHLARDGQRMIDLHGLHVSEAIPMLKRELAAVRAKSRATSNRQCVYICVGTGHHTKGARTPARIPIAIERFLAEDERLAFTEVQPGLLRVFVQ